MERKTTETRKKTVKVVEVAKTTVWQEGNKAIYDNKSKTYTAKETIGVKLLISSNGLSAIVRGVYVPLMPNADGKITFKPVTKKTAKFDENSGAFVSEKWQGAYCAAVKFLRAQYSIEDKDYSKLVELARKGTPLMTKKELKEVAKKTA